MTTVGDAVAVTAPKERALDTEDVETATGVGASHTTTTLLFASDALPAAEEKRSPPANGATPAAATSADAVTIAGAALAAVAFLALEIERGESESK